MENVKEITDKKVAEELVKIKIIMEELQEQSDNFKKELLERGIKETYYFPEYESKILLTEGRSSSDYKVLDIYADMIKEGLLEHFPKIVKVNNAQVDTIEDVDKKNKIKSILLNHVVVTKGTPSISVAKMTLKEKKEISK